MIFDRDYELTIQYDGIQVVVKPPMRISFDAYKATSGYGLNKCTLQVYNLKPDTRLKLVKNPEDGRLISFNLKVGYNGQLKTTFSGQVLRGELYRDDVDFVNKLQSLDGGADLLGGIVAKTVKGKENAISQILDGLETSIGTITTQSQLTRPKVIVGNAIKAIESFLEDEQSWFIDNGKLNIIKDSEVIDGFIPLVNSDTGLITTPTRDFNIIEFETMMNPSIRLGGLVQLESVVNPMYNGRHQVYEINYKGDYDGDNWSMAVKCRVGTYVSIK